MRRRELLSVAALVLPRAAGAQQSERSYRMSYLALLPDEDVTIAKPFFRRLQELGYGLGKNLVLSYRSAEGRPERLAELAAELMQAKPDVLVAGFGTLAAKAAAAATRTTPVVFTQVGDAIDAGLVTSLARPGGNVTGVSAQANDIAGKQLQSLEELVREKGTIAVLLNPDTPFTALALREVRAAAEQNHQPLAVFEARTPNQVSTGIEAAIKVGVVGLIVLDDPLMLSARQHITGLVAAARLPAIAGFREFTEAGGLMSYGPDQKQLYRLAAEYVDKILKGARPADLPVEQPTKVAVLINLKTAKALGVTIPPSLLASADEVIE
jgi:putative ABC transport system substrate-binding protein